MNKLKTALVGALLFVSGAAFAEGEFADVVNDSAPFKTVSVSSYVNSAASNQLFSATLVSGATTWLDLLEGRKGFEIQNLSTTADVFCLIGLSSTSANGDLALSAPGLLSTSVGQKIAPGAVRWYGFRARNNDQRVFVPFCTNNSGSGAVTVGVTQVRNR